MSRGLGVRQRQFLIALASLEDVKGKRGSFYVSTVVSSVWKNTTVKAEYDEWLRLRTIAQQEQEARRAAALDVRRAEMTAQAAEGDEKAKKWLDASRQFAVLGLALRRPPKKGRRLQRRPETTGNGWNSIEAMLNPSRIIAELAERGLVGTRGRGIVHLTEAGRDKCANLLPTLKRLPPTLKSLDVRLGSDSIEAMLNPSRLKALAEARDRLANLVPTT
jgi:hypothetical protein